MKRSSRRAPSPSTGHGGRLAPLDLCLARATAVPPSGDDWVHEIKFDGYRVQAILEDGKARLITRNGLDWTGRFGAVVKTVAALPARTLILDGEAIVQDARGVSDFGALQQELKLGRAARIALMAFDLLHLDGDDLCPRPLLERKTELARLLGPRPSSSLLQISAHMQGDGREILANACAMGLEGIVSKRANRPYRSGRHGDWLKIKCVMTDPFVIIGYVDQKGVAEAVGALAMGYYDGGVLQYAGRVGTGFTAAEAHALWQGLQVIRNGASPLPAPLTREQREGLVWVEPRLVAEVEYRGWSADKLLRHASFKSILARKGARNVGRPATFR